MLFVYFLKSLRYSRYVYVGLTSDIERRLAEHNAKISRFATAPYRPLRLAGYVAVENEDKAKALEKYFKSGSGKAFLNKRILL